MTWDRKKADAVVKKAKQRLYFLRQLKKFGLRREIIVKFDRCAIESMLLSSQYLWYSVISASTEEQGWPIKIKSWQYYLRLNAPRSLSFLTNTVRQVT